MAAVEASRIERVLGRPDWRAMGYPELTARARELETAAGFARTLGDYLLDADLANGGDRGPQPKGFASTRSGFQVSSMTVVLTWAERQQLVERLRADGRAAGLVGRFEAVGTSAPVELEPGDADVLLDVLVAWQEGGGSPAPDGIRALAAMVWRIRSSGR